MRRGLRTVKRIEPQLDVLVEIGGEIVRAGTLALHEDADQFQASFAYLPAYLERALAGRAFPLDPINLPLRERPFETLSRFFLLGALFDAAPDAWGRTVMASDEAVSPTALTEAKVLLKGRGSGVGAILFAQPGAQIVRPDASDLPRIGDVAELYKTVAAIESGVQVDERLRDMLMSSWDMGGARPKAVVQDDLGMEWIVKFPRKIDTYSRSRNEWANLEMARDIGMRVPPTRLIELDGGDCALLIARFDRGEPGRMLRQHYLSAVSLVSPPADFDKRKLDTPFGASIFSYARLAEVVRVVSEHVSHDLQELFARMVLNILLHNTDDHLKNTGFLMDAQTFHYHLSPLFDVVTQEATTKHMLHLGPPGESGTDGRVGNLDRARAGALQWGLRPQAVEAIIDRVQAIVADRQLYYRRAGMDDAEIALVERWLPRIDGHAAPEFVSAPSSRMRG